jgi:hypothetical protein
MKIMDDEDTIISVREENCDQAKRNFFGRMLKDYDFTELTVDQLERIMSILDEGLVKKDCINTRYLELIDKMRWVLSLKIGDQVIYYNDGYLDITRIAEISKDGSLKIEASHQYVGVDGRVNNSSTRRIMPVTQQALDTIEKRELLELLHNNVRYNDICLADLKDIYEKAKQNNAIRK